MSFKCPDCIKEYDNIISLAKHWVRGHKQKTDVLYLKLKGWDSPPKCGCGCGIETNFLDAGRGYAKYVRGHTSRLPGQNNFQKSNGFEKSITTRRKMFAEGKIRLWCKGKTKDDPVLAAAIKKGLETVRSNPEELKRRSETMRINRLNGTVPTLYGSAHSQWKGGTSNLRCLLKTSTKLYYFWKLPKLCSANFICQKCGCDNNLQVHHDQETMSEILRKIAKNNNIIDFMTKPVNEIPEEILSLKQKLINDVVNYHIENKVSGIVLCKQCHKLEHPSHNF